MFVPRAPTRSEFMRRLADALSVAKDAACDALDYDYEAQPGDGWVRSMKRVEAEINQAVEVLRRLRAAGHTW